MEDRKQQPVQVRIQSEWTAETLKELLDAYVRNTQEQFTAQQRNALTYRTGIDERFKHMEQLFQAIQASAQIAVDKAEAAQRAHNIGANEWRSTLNDFKTSLVSRTEFDRFYAEFAAYRLESARMAASIAGNKEGTRETKETSMAQMTLIAAAVSALVAVVVPVLLAVVRSVGKA